MKSTRIVAKVLLITPDQHILLLKRSKTDNRRPLQWDLPGGAVDEGEDYVSAACRETQEEAGVVIRPEDCQLGFVYADNTPKGNVCWLYFVVSITDKPEVVLSHEHCDVGWVPINVAARKILYERQQAAIRHIMQYVLD